MLNNILKICCDAIKMVRKNLKTYVLLSVTLVISFSALGIYLIYTDSVNFNDNKEYLKVSPNIIITDYYDWDKENVKLLKKGLDKMENTYYQTSLEISLLRRDVYHRMSPL